MDGVETTLVFVDHPGGNTEVRPAVLKYQFSTSFSPEGSNINFLVLSKGRNSDEYVYQRYLIPEAAKKIYSLLITDFRDILNFRTMADFF